MTLQLLVIFVLYDYNINHKFNHIFENCFKWPLIVFEKLKGESFGIKILIGFFYMKSKLMPSIMAKENKWKQQEVQLKIIIERSTWVCKV